MKNKTKGRDVRRVFFAATAACAVLALAACASDDEVAADVPPPAAAPASSAPAPSAASGFGAAPAPRFIIPSAADQSPPNVNTVPATAPTPTSTPEEREDARRGLIADLANARHSDLGGRTQPVTVRPYVASAAPAPTVEEPAPAPETTRLDTPPPVRPPEADAAPAKPAAGPAPANRIPTGS